MPRGCAVFNGTSAFGVYSPGGNIITTLPITLCCWFKTSTAQVKNIASVITPAAVNAAIRQETATAAANRNFGTGLPIGGTLVNDGSAWNSLVAVFTATDTRIYAGGALGATDGTDIPADNLTSIIVGSATVAGADFTTGRFAHLSVHLANFTLSDAQAHNAGVLASALPSPFAWYKLETDGQDSIGTRHMTLTDVTFDAADGPAVVYPSGVNPWGLALPVGRPVGLRPYDSKRLRPRR